MKVLLISIDSKIDNLALKKVERYYLDRGDEVFWNDSKLKDEVDKIYVSCVFTKNRDKVKEWEGKALIGGSGYDLTTVLPEELECQKPKINLGFTTRGCIRKCKFCIVSQKEGHIRAVGDLLDLWDGKTKDVMLLDNNILALPEHFKMICKQAIDNKIRLDFNQGLDCRLLTQEIVDLLREISHREYKFAFDSMSYLDDVERACNLLWANGLKWTKWYILVGFETTFEEDLKRVQIMKDNGLRVYIQRYETCYSDPRYIALAKWGNQPSLFAKLTWSEFLERPDIQRYRKWFM